MTSLILRTAVTILHPLLLLYSVLLLVRGHNEPGGGFVGGLVAAASFAFHAIGYDVPSTRKLARFSPHTFIGAGLVIALASGLLALVAGEPYLTGYWTELRFWPFSGAKLGTPLVFDAGVYLVVLGVLLIVIFSLMED